MAFIRSGWRSVGGENRDGNGGQVFSYVNVDDTTTEIKASAYFNDIAKAVSQNDIIWIVGSDGVTFAAVDTSGKPITVSSGLPNDSEFGVAASVTQTQAGGTLLVAFSSVVTTVSVVGDSLRLPSAAIRPMRMHVYNATANAAELFPADGETINAGVADASVTLTNQRILDSNGLGNWDDH